MKFLPIALTFATLAVVAVSALESRQPSTQDLAMDVFFSRLNKAPVSSSSPVNNNNKAILKIQPIDVSWIMDEVGKTLVASITKVLQHFFQAIMQLIAGGIGGKAGDKALTFNSRGDVIEFGRRLQAAYDHRLLGHDDGKQLDNPFELTIGFDKETKKELLTTVLDLIVTLHHVKGGETEKIDFLKMFERIANNL